MHCLLNIRSLPSLSSKLPQTHTPHTPPQQPTMLQALSPLLQPFHKLFHTNQHVETANPTLYYLPDNEQTSNSFHEMSHVDDSDSDLEDLHHVIEESRQQIAVAEQVLNKHHKDVLDTGLYMDASKYVSLHSTIRSIGYPCLY